MNAGSNTIENMDAAFADECFVERTSLLGSAPIRIWLALLLVLFGIGTLGGFTQLAQAVATSEPSSLKWLFSLLAGLLGVIAISFGQAASTPMPVRAERRAQAGFNDAPQAAYAAQTEAAVGPQIDCDDDFTEYFDVSKPATVDPLAAPMPTAQDETGTSRPAATEAAPAPQRQAESSRIRATGPAWLLRLDDYLTRPIALRTIIIIVALTSTVSAFATWHLIGSISETLTALIGVAVLSALFSRVTQTAAQSRQVAADLRTTNNHLVQEIVSRRVRDQLAAGETDGEQRWASSLDFERASLSELEALRTKFLSEVSHELRGPITAINLAARIIMKHHIYDHEVVERFGSTIVIEGDRLAHIVNEFLELAKIESCCVRWSEDRIEPADAVSTALFAAEASATEREITLITETENDIPVMLADRDRVIQALTILVNTAVRNAPEKGKITVHARRGSAETLFAVEDDGAGTREEKPYNIFGDAPARGDERDGKENCGQGLGLCIASEIATHYGGEMWIEGRVGEGSAYILSFPDQQPSTDTGADSNGDDGVDKNDAAGDDIGTDTKDEAEAFSAIEEACPTSIDVNAPLLTNPDGASALPSIFDSSGEKPSTADSLGETTPPDENGDQTDDASEVGCSDAGDSSPAYQSEVAVSLEPAPAAEAHAEVTDALGAVDASTIEELANEEPVVTDSYDPESLPWDEEFELPPASEQLSLRELDDLMYGRVEAPSQADDDEGSGDGGNDDGDDDDDPSGSSLKCDDSQTEETPAAESICAATSEESVTDESVIDSPHLTEIKRGFGFSLYRSEELSNMATDEGRDDTAPITDDTAKPETSDHAQADQAPLDAQTVPDTETGEEPSEESAELTAEDATTEDPSDGDDDATGGEGGNAGDSGDPFKSWLTEKTADQDSAPATSGDDDGSDQTGDRLTHALSQLERTTSDLTNEVAARETLTTEAAPSEESETPIQMPTVAHDTKDALNAIAAGISNSNAAELACSGDEESDANADDDLEDQSVVASRNGQGRSEPAVMRAASRAPKNDIRKPHGGWELASRVGASFGRRTPHRR